MPVNRVLHGGLDNVKIDVDMKSISVPADDRGFRTTATRFSVVCVVCLVTFYVLGYAFLRNRGMREMRRYESEGFLYDSVENVIRTHDLRVHHFRSRIFAPLNFFDQLLFEDAKPVMSILFELS